MIKEFLTKLFPVWDETKIRVGSLVTGTDPRGHELFQGYVTKVDLTMIWADGAVFHPDGTFCKWSTGWHVSSSDKEQLEVLKY